MLQNVRLMKWAHYYGIKVAWNLLTGFPGETLEDYEAQARADAEARPPAATDRRRLDLDGALQPVLHRGLVSGQRRRAVEGVQLRLPARSWTFGRSPTSSRTRWGMSCPKSPSTVCTKAIGRVAEALGLAEEARPRVPARPGLDPDRRPARRRGDESARVPGDWRRPRTSCAATSERRRGWRPSSTRLPPKWRARCASSATAA